jgi:hypothetical protein
MAGSNDPKARTIGLIVYGYPIGDCRAASAEVGEYSDVLVGTERRTEQCRGVNLLEVIGRQGELRPRRRHERAPGVPEKEKSRARMRCLQRSDPDGKSAARRIGHDQATFIADRQYLRPEGSGARVHGVFLRSRTTIRRVVVDLHEQFGNANDARRYRERQNPVETSDSLATQSDDDVRKGLDFPIEDDRRVGVGCGLPRWMKHEAAGWTKRDDRHGRPKEGAPGPGRRDHDRNDPIDTLSGDFWIAAIRERDGARAHR